VYDAMLGTPLHFEVVSGAQARNDALMPDADLETNYIKVTLARPVPEHGQGRVLIVKTYHGCEELLLGRQDAGVQSAARRQAQQSGAAGRI
jgi:hypothetical protein